jgi:hypothetical protein
MSNMHRHGLVGENLASPQVKPQLLSVSREVILDGYRNLQITSGARRMSIFGNIMSSIFGGSSSPAAPPAAPQSAASLQSAAPLAAMAQVPTPAKPQVDVAASPQSSAMAQGPTATQVDVAAVMDNLAEQSDEDLDWRKSMVDLMKLLKLDSSLSARKQLAKELQYAGNTNDSAAMNIWLHKQVMLKLAENGGKIPSDIKH